MDYIGLMQNWIAAPPAPEVEGASARVHLRYEDVCQDGRLLLEVLPNALGSAVWGAQLSKESVAKTCMEQGVIPILTRFVIEGAPGPFGVMTPLGVVGRFALAQGDGRVYLNMWADLSGPIARTYPPQPENAGTIAPAGKIFGEHVFTRLFAPPGERRVEKLDVPGVPDPLPEYAARPLASLIEIPDGVRALDDLSPDDSPITFGLVHTDSNHHVNSLVYIRLFEEAALRAFAKLGRTEPLLARRLEIAYRKPCFTGDRMRIHVRVVEVEGRLGALAILAKEGDPSSAHVASRLVFE
ncbi:MAG TPA: acyl-CoA thioesterase [Polyangiaceae bacterium]